MTQLTLMLYFSKTARNFLTILTLHKVDNISFQMSLGSHLAALVWQTGVHRNVARIKMWYGEIWSEADMTQLSLMLYFSKTARNFFTILSLNMVDNIPFQMSLGSHLAALVWQTAVHKNVARNKEVIWRNLVGSWHDTTNFDVILFKNGSKFSLNTYPAQSRQYFFSNEPGQPFSRAGLTDWRSYKRSEK